MAYRPRLKSITVHGSDGQVVLWPRALRRVFLDDDSGSVTAILRLLAEGTRETGELRSTMTEHGFEVTDDEINGLLSALDGLGVLEGTDSDAAIDGPTLERHQSNLRFYELFSSLERSSMTLHERAARSRVLLLGAGGLGSGILQSLVGLGVGEVILVDVDVVEMKNLARQFVYGLGAIGRPKVAAARDWVTSYSTGTRITPVDRRITDAASIVELGAGADIVVCAIDSPDDIHLIVNEACFTLGVPFVAGGLNYSTLSYWSVDPGTTPCQLCLTLHRTDEIPGLPPVLRQEPILVPRRINRATGPVVQIISGLMSMEIMRYLTRSDPPIAGAAYQLLELADRMETSRAAWQRHRSCPLCCGAA